MTARKLKSNPESAPIPQDKPGGNTSWKAGVPANGWYRYPDNWWRDLPRLQRGLYQRMLIEYVWGSMVPRDKDRAMPEWSVWLSWSDMADLFRCSPEQLRDDARDAGKRGLVMLEESRGRVRFRITWERWGNLKDYVAPRPVAVEKPAKPVRWFSRGVTIEPGASFLLPKFETPAEQMELRNTSKDGRIKLAAGSCEGGRVVLDAAFEVKSDPVKSVASQENRDYTPQTKPSSKTDPVVQQISDVIGSYGPVTLPAITRMIAASHVPADEVLISLAEVKPPEGAENPVGWILAMVPRYFAGVYKPSLSSKKKKQTERERLAREIWGSAEKTA